MSPTTVLKHTVTSATARETDMEGAARRIPPVVRTVDVKWSRAEAFERFTAGIARWWPLRSHSVGQARAESVVFEDRVGGRIYETVEGGETHTWGTVLEWDPPTGVKFTWHPGREADSAQQVEVRFEASEHGTRLVLTHSGWEALGRRGSKARFGYNVGWIPVLDRWADRRTIAGSAVDGLGGFVSFVVGLVRRR